jgi:rare lipoprotein A
MGTTPLNRSFRLRRPWSGILFFFLFISQDIRAQENQREFLPRVQLGKATFYCPSFHGNRTAWGNFYDEKELVAAHPYYPFGTTLRVTNLANNRKVEVVVIDRGPSRKHQQQGGILDVSRGAARELGMLLQGRARVRVEVLEWGPHKARFDKK